MALGRQLYALGLVSDPLLSFTDAAVELLMEMYEIVGNQIALQYAGSEAVHAMKNYDRGRFESSLLCNGSVLLTRCSGIAAQSRDLLTTIKRYYSNSFTDSEKQQAMNLFLGRFVPSPNARDIWDLEHDWLLHNRVQFVEHHLITIEQWWREPLAAFDASLGALRFAPKPPPLYLASSSSSPIGGIGASMSSPSMLSLLLPANDDAWHALSNSADIARAVQARLRRRRRSVTENRGSSCCSSLTNTCWGR